MRCGHAEATHMDGESRHTAAAAAAAAAVAAVAAALGITGPRITHVQPCRISRCSCSTASLLGPCTRSTPPSPGPLRLLPAGGPGQAACTGRVRLPGTQEEPGGGGAGQ